MDNELLDAIRTMIQEELKPLKVGVESLKTDVAEIKESLDEVRTGSNTLLN